MGAASGCDGNGGRRLALLMAMSLWACSAEPPAAPRLSPREALRVNLLLLHGGESEALTPPRTPAGADPVGLLALGDAYVVALEGDAAVALTDGSRELARAAAPTAVRALVADGEGGFVAGGAHEGILQRYTVEGQTIEPKGRVVLPGTEGIGALAGADGVIFGTEAFGTEVFRIELGDLPELRRGEGCRQARGIVLVADRVVVACTDGGLVALDAATLAPVARARFPGPLLALTACDGPGVRVVTSGIGRDGSEAPDATQSLLRLHALRDDGWVTLHELPSDDAEEARVVLHEDGTLDVFGHARGLRKTFRVRGDVLERGETRPWVLGVRAAVASGDGTLTSSALLDGLVSAGPSGVPRASLRFAAGRERFGEVLLTTGFGRPEGTSSCGACHLDGRGDFRRHAFGGDGRGAPTTWFRGLFREPRGVERVQDLQGAHRGADLAVVSDPDTRVAAASRFLARWTRAPSSLAIAGRDASELEHRGIDTYVRECMSCHQLPEGRAPRLFRVARRGPYLADWDGLDDVLSDLRVEPFAHRGDEGRPLTTPEREALRAYLSVL